MPEVKTHRDPDPFLEIVRRAISEGVKEAGENEKKRIMSELSARVSESVDQIVAKIALRISRQVSIRDNGDRIVIEILKKDA